MADNADSNTSLYGYIMTGDSITKKEEEKTTTYTAILVKYKNYTFYISTFPQEKHTQ